MIARTRHRHARPVDPNDEGATPAGSARDARFWDRMAERYAASPVTDPDAYARKLAWTRDHLHADAEVLELGCGTGSTAIAHAPHVRRITATDASRHMIAIAREKAAKAGAANVHFMCRSASQVQATQASFDAVMVHSLLHLLPDWRDTIGDAYRVLQPGGAFVSSTPCMNDGFGFLRPVAGAGRVLGLLPRLSFFGADDLRRAVQDAGFEIVVDWRPAPRKALFLIARKPS